ncbi:hypothetical protein [Prosthecobacter sp.]|uniref:hypothetical protein n=1 Tax=Prosthecobacter sp. TaxID=1965333 RepID=UPI003784BD4B
MGIETLAFDSAPFWCLNQENVSEEAVALRWESLGLSNAGEASLWLHWPVMRKNKRVLVATLALSGESLPAEGWSGRPAQFEPSVRMLPLPENGIAVWRELGRQVVTFSCGGRLLHAAVLASRVLDVDAAFEIRDLCAALQAHDFVTEPPAVHVWTACETDFIPQLACLFVEAEVRREARPDPRPPETPGGLLPLQVAALRQQQQTRQSRLLLLAAAAVMYLCFFGAWWLRLQWREGRVNQTEAELTARQPELDRVAQAQSQWQALEGAVNPDLYPVEVFHQIVSLLPEEGVRLKEFHIENGKVVVSGEATTVNHALGFKGRLTTCAGLQHYEWSFPLPSIREDNRAEFRAEGTFNAGGPVHEGQ